MERNTRSKPNGTEHEDKTEWNGGRDRMRRRQTAQRGEREREREREREKRERERKYSQFINKLSRALPNVRARSGYIQVPPAFAFYFRPSLQHPVFPYPPPLAPCFVSVSRYRTGARRRWALRCAVVRRRWALRCAVVRRRWTLRCAGVRRRCALRCAGVRRRWALHCAGVRRRWVLRCCWGAGVRYHRRRTIGAPCRRRALLCAGA